MLDKYTGAEQEHGLRIWYDKAVDDVGRRERSDTVTLAIEQPQMARKYTIA